LGEGEGEGGARRDGLAGVDHSSVVLVTGIAGAGLGPGGLATAAQLEVAERLALAADPMLRLQMAAISPEYHAHTHSHTHAHSHTHLHLHPGQQGAQAAQVQGLETAPATAAGYPLPGEESA